jgi:hypothetical protein
LLWSRRQPSHRSRDLPGALTRNGAELEDRVRRLAVKIEVPRLGRKGVHFGADTERQLFLARLGLAIKDEEGRDVVLLELVQNLFDVVLDAGEAAEGDEEGLMVGIFGEKDVAVVCRVDADGAVLEVRDGADPRRDVRWWRRGGGIGRATISLGLVQDELVPVQSWARQYGAPWFAS